MNFTNEQLTKAKSAKSAEELLTLAKESGIEMTEEQAAKYFAELNKEGELTDSELDSVAGGKGDDDENKYNGYPMRNSLWGPCDPYHGAVDICEHCSFFERLPNNATIGAYDGYCKKK